MKRVLIIDCLNTLFQLYHTGVNDKAFKFLNDMKDIASQFKVDRVVLACDGGSSRYRLEKLPTYKADRKKKRAEAPPEEQNKLKKFLQEDVKDAVELCRQVGIPVLQYQGVEADDIIAFFANNIDTSKYNLMILSTDTDLNQLIRPGIVQCGYNRELTNAMAEGKIPASLWMNTDGVIEKWGLTPEQYGEAKSLCGDPGDSIKSVVDLGEGSALKLIKEYGSLKEIERLCIEGKEVSVPRMKQTAKANLRADFSVVWKAFDLINLRYGAEKAKEILGLDAYSDLVYQIDKLAEPRNMDVAVFKEMLFEYGRLAEIEQLDSWIGTFVGK